MNNLSRFSYHRRRGIVWVCDVARSSAYLNSESAVAALEEYLPRLYVVANSITNAAGGEFIKWTGDGFMSWFETPLHRETEITAKFVARVAYDLTFLANVTSLGVKTESKFKLRHGIAYEHDALVMDITFQDGHASKDLLGRGVVLASRLASVNSTFPDIVTHGDLSEGISGVARLKKWRPSASELEKYFKGEKWGTNKLYVSAEAKPKKASPAKAVKQAEHALNCAEGKTPIDKARIKYMETFIATMCNGPTWGKDIIDEQARFIETDLKGNLEKLLSLIKNKTKPEEEKK